MRAGQLLLQLIEYQCGGWTEPSCVEGKQQQEQHGPSWLLPATLCLDSSNLPQTFMPTILEILQGDFKLSLQHKQ